MSSSTGIAGGARDRVDQHALLPGQLVQQAGLADVGAPDERHPARAAFGSERFARRGRQRVEHGVEEISAAAAVQRADRTAARRARATRARRRRARRERRRPCWRPARPACVTGAARRRRPSSASVTPTTASTTNSTASAASTATRACAATRAARSLEPLDGRLPAAGVHQREGPAAPGGVVGDPVPGDARGCPRRPPACCRGSCSPGWTCRRSACRRRPRPARAPRARPAVPASPSVIRGIGRPAGRAAQPGPRARHPAVRER